MANQKNGQTFSISRVMKSSSTVVWDVIGNRYGELEKYHPDVFASDYVEGHTAGGEGSERVVYLNKERSKIAHEIQLDFDPQKLFFRSQATKFSGAAMRPEQTFMKYKIEPIDDKSCELIGEMSFRTKPAFIGWIFKNGLKSMARRHFESIDDFASKI